MYLLAYPAAILLASSIFFYARHPDLIFQNGAHSHFPSPAKPDVCMTPQCVLSAADVLSSLDETVDPCDDFYKFACGGWLKQKELREDQREISSMVEMQTALNRKLKELLESKYESSDPHFVKMLKDFYKTCVDLDGTGKDGSERLMKMLSRLGGWPVIEGAKWDESAFDWVDSLISLRKLGFNHNILLGLSVSNFYIFSIELDLPKMRASSREEEIWHPLLGSDAGKMDLYMRAMVEAARLLGGEESAAEKELREVLNFTIALENCISNLEKLKMEEAGYMIYSVYTVRQLKKEVPKIPWRKYLNGMFNEKIYKNEDVLVKEMHFIKKLADLISSTEKRVIANYMMAWVVLESSEFLSAEWDSVHEKVNKLTLKESYKRDVRIVKPRWKRCVSSVAEEMKIALSSYYVRHSFSDESKDKAMIIFKYVHTEFRRILEENDWMDENTRKKAEEKANAMGAYIGYPKQLLNDTFMMKIYENLTISTDSHLENILSLHKMAVDEELSNHGKPVDLKNPDYLKHPQFRHILQMNAFYYDFYNSIVIPAVILHDALYVKDRPNYLNFGAIGYVFGHEITHGFDNRGRKFDKDGDRVSWSHQVSNEHFNKKAQCLIDQYDNYTTDIGLKVNGGKTLDENIADNGALKEAYWAYQSWKKDNGIEPTLPGLNYTQNQLFWVSAAHVWCSKYQPEFLKLTLLEDPHSPGRYRIIGPMSNLKEFSKDFKCSADSRMNRKHKCKIW